MPRALALIAACLLTACTRRAPVPAASPSPTPVDLAVAHAGSLRPTVRLPGIVAPIEDVTLTSSLSEPADSVNVREGDRVHAGEVLATLDTADLRANLLEDQRIVAQDRAKLAQTRYQAQQTASSATSGVTAARATLTQDQRKLALDTLTLQRDEELLAKGYIARANVDQQRAQVAEDRAAVRSAQASLENAQTTAQTSGSASGGANAASIAASRAAVASAQAAAGQIRTQIAKATIRSPIDGIVVNRNLNPGEYPGTRDLFTIQKLNPVYVNLSASSSQIFALAKGDAVTCTISGLARSYHGHVVAVLGELTPGSTNFTVKAQIANPGDRLQSGMVVSGTVTLPPRHGVIVPTAAFLTPAHQRIMIDVGGVARSRAVHAVTHAGGSSIVTGIPAGTRVVADGTLGLVDGQPVAAR